MTRRLAVVTGASGFVGRHVVAALGAAGFSVRACVRRAGDRARFEGSPGVEPVTMDLSDADSIARAVAGAVHVHHCAALLDPHASRQQLLEVNAEGTRRVWECAAAAGVRKALYCSSTAVYGLLAGRAGGITEEVPPRAVEPYGSSKLLGERAALEVAAQTGLHTTIVRPVAVFGPGERTKFGSSLREAALTRLLGAGGFRNRSFSFVHVEDVAAALVFLAESDLPGGEIYNLSAGRPVPFEEAFQAYERVLRRAGRRHVKAWLYTALSAWLLRHPRFLSWFSRLGGDRFTFKIWRPGFDLTYSPAKLLGTSFRFRWENFEEVLASCL